MKENLNEEIKRNLELMGVQVNETTLQRLIKMAADKISDFFSDDDEEEKSKEEKSGEKEDEIEKPEADINKLEKDSEEEKIFIDNLESELNIRDISSMSTFRASNLKHNDFFVVHHTAPGMNSCEDVVRVLNGRGLGVQWVVDRRGNLCKTLPFNQIGGHVNPKKRKPNGIKAYNENSQGVEVIADNDADVLPVQAVTVLKLIRKLGFPTSKIYGHGEINTHKAANEGQTIKSFINRNYNKSPRDYDFSMFPAGKRPDFSPM